MPDLLDSIRRDLHERLDELRPLVSEYERLAAADQALDSGAGASRRASRTDTTRRAPRRRRRTAAKRRASTPAERQANRERLLSLIAERPGVSRAELKQATGLSAAGVAQSLRRLMESGEVVEEPLPSGDAGYRLGASQDARGADAEAVRSSGGAEAGSPTS